ncbi:MAG: carboxypeptidase regulatory-like domain-containing protein [Spirochaetes bacterium]|nr:MAG: carboxypeptidase regulatory-like domain-containing protein [Spirochaetota bacterium]
MKTMKLFFLALLLTCMAGCSYDMSDVIGDHESNVLDPSKGFDSQGTDALVYGKVTCVGAIDAGATVTVHDDGGTLGEPVMTDANGMYGVRFNVVAFAYNVQIDVSGTCSVLNEPVSSMIDEGESVRKDVVLP